ncbi:MAG TPA: PIN domain-containing protein [Stellaceae bacterium]|nr:PIN domain-containing protein [Stellaceae bacterium]
MKGWLLDTDILSAFAPGRPGIPQGTAAWFDDRAEALYLSAITAAEIEAGIAKLFRMGAARRGDALRVWFDRILALYADRVLSFDLAAARLAGALTDAARADRRYPGFADVAIAAIAKTRELVVVTLNRRHFDPLGVEVFNPFAPD